MINELRILVLILVSLPGVVTGQTAPTIGTNAAGFLLFTSNGALTGIGDTQVSGVIGTNLGNYSGFSPSVVYHHENTTSDLAATDMAAFSFAPAPEACAEMTLALGNAQTLSAGVYCKTDATVFSGDLILDAENQPGAVFIFQIGGAVTLQALARIVLINGATPANVYFKVLGAVTLSAGSVFRGTIINNGAISLTSATLIGKALTTNGEITVNESRVSGSEAPLPVTLTSFEAKKGEHQNALLFWTTTMESNSDRFEIQNSKTGKTWRSVGSVKAAKESNTLNSYAYKLENQEKGSNFYRLKMIDNDETFAYSRIRNLDFTAESKTILYPNPAADQLTLRADDVSSITRIQFTDVSGKSVYDKVRSGSSSLSQNLNIGHFASGLYLATITMINGDTEHIKIIKR